MKKYFNLSVCFSMLIGSFVFANAQLHDVETIKRVQREIKPLIDAKWSEVNQFYCPDPLSENSLQYLQDKSTKDLMIFELTFNGFGPYCTDGLPFTCMVSVSALKENKWDTSGATIKDCNNR